MMDDKVGRRNGFRGGIYALSASVLVAGLNIPLVPIGIGALAGNLVACDFRLENRKHKKRKRDRPNTPQNPTEIPTDPTGQTGPHNIYGGITDIIGSPIDNQPVFYNPEDSSVSRRGGDSDSDGAYSVESIPAQSLGRLVVDRPGYSLFGEDLRFVERSVDATRDIVLLPELALIEGTDRREYQVRQTRQGSFLMFLKYITGNRDGESAEGGADPFQGVEAWREYLEPVPVSINTGDVNLDDLIEEGLNRINDGASMRRLDQGNIVTVPIYERVPVGDAKISIKLGRNQGVSVLYGSILHDSIGAEPELGLKAVSPYESVEMLISDRVHPAEVAREAERGLGWLALGPHAMESVHPGHLLSDKTISLSGSYTGPNGLSHDELNAIQVYRSLRPGRDMRTYRNR
jgi:hypothetical protein